MSDPWMSGVEFWRLFAVAGLALVVVPYLWWRWECRPRRVDLHPVPDPYRKEAL